VRTTININDHLMHQLKKLAAETHRTLTSVIEDALRWDLGRRDQMKNRPKVKLPTFKGDGLMPGVDIHNSARLWDITEKR
jgi:hypothetical protein